MRLAEKTDSHLRFDLPRQELHLFHVILSIYPVRHTTPESTPVHPPGSAPDPELLLSALQDLKSENKTQLDSFLTRITPEIAFSDTSADPRTPCSLQIQLEEIDFLLQVLNEIRVGCWYQLGCPEDPVDTLPLQDSAATQKVMIMMFSSMFQETLIDALDSPAP